MFGTRADLVVDLTFLATLMAPVVCWVSFRLTRARRHDVHRRIQTGLLVACFSSVIAFEVRIRLGGGSGTLLAGAPESVRGLAHTLLAVHITGAVVTYVAWLVLLVVSRRRYRSTLPGRFSRWHKRTGWTVFGGLCFTAASAIGMYVLAFVA